MTEHPEVKTHIECLSVMTMVCIFMCIHRASFDHVPSVLSCCCGWVCMKPTMGVLDLHILNNIRYFQTFQCYCCQGKIFLGLTITIFFFNNLFVFLHLVTMTMNVPLFCDNDSFTLKWHFVSCFFLTKWFT